MYQPFLNSQSTLSVWCWFRGSESHVHSWSPVHLPTTTTPRIETLKELVAARGQTQANPSSIDIYTYPEGRSISPEDVGSLSISMLGSPLQAGQELSREARFVVDHPTVDVYCSVRGPGWESSFVVHTSKNVTLDELKTTIKAKDLELTNVPTSSLRLYKTPESTKDQELSEPLSVPDFGELLDRDQSLRTLFDETPLCKTPCVVVECPEEDVPKTPPSAASLPTRNDDPVARARVDFLVASEAEKRQHSDAGMASSQPNSQGYSPSELLHRQECQEIDQSLLHPVFAQLLDDIEDIDGPFGEPASYSIEDTWVETVYKVLQSEGISFTRVKKRGSSISGYMSVKGHPYVIAKVQNKLITPSTSDPFQDPLAYYQEATRETAVKFSRSPLPCILLTVAGTDLWLSCATWNLRPMTPSVHTSTHFGRLGAFLNAIDSLKQYYEGLEETPLSVAIPPIPHLFPHLTSYTSSFDLCTRKDFQYTKRIDDKKLLFLGTEADGTRIWIRFISSSGYSRQPHELCVSWGCAPALRGIEKTPSGRVMVVMDALPDDFEPLSSRTDPIPSTLSAEMTAKEEEFRKGGFTGKFKDMDVMVSKDGNRFMVTNFEGVYMTQLAAARYNGWGPGFGYDG